jgi:hypothetical protein
MIYKPLAPAVVTDLIISYVSPSFLRKPTINICASDRVPQGSIIETGLVQEELGLSMPFSYQGAQPRRNGQHFRAHLEFYCCSMRLTIPLSVSGGISIARQTRYCVIRHLHLVVCSRTSCYLFYGQHAGILGLLGFWL